MYPLISILVGLLLGARFNFLVLIPASGCGLALTVGAAVARAESVDTTIFATIMVLTGLQLGYLAGAAARPLLSTPLGWLGIGSQPGNARGDRQRGPQLLVDQA
jgi:hypothetical protein